MTVGAYVYPAHMRAEAEEHLATLAGAHMVRIDSTYYVVEAGANIDFLLRGLRASGARSSDPDTSHAAAAGDRTTDRARALAILRAHPEGLTDDALAELMDRRPTSAGKRRLELVHAGLVEQTDERRATRTGSPAIVWRATGGDAA